MATSKVRRRVRTRLRPSLRPAVPATMRAAVLHRFGGPRSFSIESVPVPKPGPNEVLIKVAVAGIGSWDPWPRGGGLGKGKFPLILGSDGAGTVVAKGARVTRFRIGERVYSFNY